jgi:hypothetical protein
MEGREDKGHVPRMLAKPKSQVQDESIMGVRPLPPVMLWQIQSFNDFVDEQ